MTLLRTSLCLISAFLFGICTAKNGDISYTADSLYASGAFEYASLEYERIVFISRNDSARDRALLGKAYCYKSLKKYADAYQTLNRINTENKADSFIFAVHYEAALCAFLCNSFLQAEQELVLLETRVKDSTLRSAALFLEVILLTEQERWKQAEEKYFRYCRLRNIKPDTNVLIHDAADLKLKNRNKAKYLSLLLPGLGQAYAGKPLRGFSSLLLTGAAVTYAVISAIDGLWITAFFTGTGFTLRFYAGGARYAARIVDQKNEKIKADYKKTVRDLILNIEQNQPEH